MSTIRVVLGHDRQDLLPAVVAETLAGLPDFHVIGGRPLRPEQIGMALSGLPIDVAVLIGESDRFDQIAEDLIAHDRATVILRLSVVEDRLGFDVAARAFGMPELVETLRTLARAPRLHGEVRAAIARDVLPSGDPLALRRHAQVWLDALFGAHLRHRRESLHRLAREGGVREEDVHWATLDPEVMLASYIEDDPPRPVAATQWAAFEAAVAASPRDPLHAVIRRLGLKALEQQALLLCLAPELDVRYQRAIGSLHDDLSRRRPTLGLICRLLGEPLSVRAELAHADALRSMGLIAGPRPDLWAADDPLELDPPLAAWLLDQGSLVEADPLLRRVIRRTAWSHYPGPPADADAERLVRQLRTRSHGERIVALGAEPEAWRVRTEAAAAAVGVELLRIEGVRLAGLSEDDQRAAVLRIARLARLFDLLPVLDAGEVDDAESGKALGAALARLSASVQHPLLVIAGAAAEFPELLFGASAMLESSDGEATDARPIAAAAAALGLAADRSDVALLTGAYRLPEGLAAAAPMVARALAAGRGPAPAGVDDLRAACRKLANPQLPRFARRISPTVTLNDVVLPEDRRRQLDEIVGHVRHASEVMDAWGFAAGSPYGRGVAALFSGPSGSGKTMSAHAIANALGCELFQVNLAAVVSKYIGETEKNLDVVFTEAERGCAVLLFDECDALFGKRSETKDSHDRYANIEVSYLLQRLEAFSAGFTVMTTNFRQNLDHGFLRRFRFVLEFPLPDPAGREAIWRQCLPDTAPLDPDIDLRFIARRLELTGGAIRQITLRAAFAAAGEASPIAMRHLVEATRAELAKAGMHQALQELTERVA
ncbi:MAG: hypothetical protein JWQ29_1221 [Phenylobacterium sp.]|nr:hypothetical protein [Phenylobacterium sp.]